MRRRGRISAGARPRLFLPLGRGLLRTVAVCLCAGFALRALADPVPVRLAGVSSAEYVTVSEGGATTTVRVPGIAARDPCYADQARLWAIAVLSSRAPLYMLENTGHTDAAGYPLVRLGWLDHGKWVDYGWTAIRAGAAANAAPLPDAAMQATYADAETEARAEGRGRWSACGSPLDAFRATATLTGVPARVLYGVAMNESEYRGRPWPWTLNVSGKSYFFYDRRTAYEAARWLLSQHIRSFDVGEMQINYKYNGYRFRSLWDALDPATNCLVAARILTENLRARGGNWAAAIGLYHSARPVESASYVRRFLAHYRQGLMLTSERTAE